MKKILLAIIFTFFAVKSFAQNFYTECLDAQRERLTALDVQDWEAILRTTDKTMKACKKHFSQKSVFEVSTAKLPALYYLNRDDELLIEANQCINTYYDLPICHYWKSVILIEKNKILEGIQTAEIGMKICKSVISNRNMELRHTENSENKFDIEAKIKEAEIILENFNHLLKFNTNLADFKK